MGFDDFFGDFFGMIIEGIVDARRRRKAREETRRKVNLLNKKISQLEMEGEAASLPDYFVNLHNITVRDHLQTA